MLSYKTELGNIEISLVALGRIAGCAATSCFGVAGMAFSDAKDGIVSLLKWDNIEKGVKISTENNNIYIDLHIVVTFGVNIAAITESITHNVSYAVENATGFKVKKINVFVDAIK